MTSPEPDDEPRRDQVLPRQDRRQLAGRVVLVCVLLYLVASNVWTQVTAEEAKVSATQATDEKETAQRQAKSLAEQVADACAKGGEAAAELGPAACTQARDVQQQPVAGDPPEDGTDGRGITGTAIADGRLMISYTDGAIEDKGPVVGTDGPPGRGIVTSSVTPAGRLVLVYSDGSTEDVGSVVGPVGADGVDGAEGPKGRGVASVTVSPEYHLIVAYDDGSTADAGPLPAGPPGRGIVSVAFDFDTCMATVSYTDDTTQQAPMTGCEPTGPSPDPPPDPPLGGLLPGG